MFKKKTNMNCFIIRSPLGGGGGNETPRVIRYGMIIAVALIYNYTLAHQQSEFTSKLKVSEQKDWSHYHCSLSLVIHAHWRPCEGG